MLRLLLRCSRGRQKGGEERSTNNVGLTVAVKVFVVCSA